MTKKEMDDYNSTHFATLLLEAMVDGVFTVNEKGIITSWNPSMERITGYKAEEATGKSCRMLEFDRCFGKACPAGVSECGIFNKGALYGKECYLTHKDGHQIPVVKNARLFRDRKNNVKAVVETVTDMTDLYKARQKAEEANRKLGVIHQFSRIIGKSPAMNKMFIALKAAAASDVTTLITGDSGTGKELVAGAIHYNSRRRNNPFITVNCSALSESLLESELFGHVKGAFTGAVKNRTGRFEEAEGGTLFLDEIGEISPFIQVKLLRVLQEREVERVGESKKRKIDIRIVAATNKDLKVLVQNGQFREDLYYRLKVFPIHTPALNERKEDIPLLIRYFIDVQNEKTGKNIKSASQPAMRNLLDYNWPGNVRELENTIEHAFVLCENDHIELMDLPIEIRSHYAAGIISTDNKNEHTVHRKRKKITKETLLEILKESSWNKAEAGRRLELSRASIWKYMKKWGIPMNPVE